MSFNRKTNAFINRADAEAKKFNIDITFQDSPDPEELHLVWFERNSNSNPGDGKKFLNKICEYADEMSIILSLVVNPHHNELVQYYTQFDFVQDGPPTDTGIPLYRHYERGEV